MTSASEFSLEIITYKRKIHSVFLFPVSLIIIKYAKI